MERLNQATIRLMPESVKVKMGQVNGVGTRRDFFEDRENERWWHERG